MARLALAAVSALLSLGAAEGIYRLRQASAPPPADDPAWRARIRAMNATLYQRSDDPALVYEPRPGARVAMQYGEAAFNLAGMRDDREHARAPDGRLRVALLGDSIAWSEEVALKDSLARALERALGGEARAEVLAFGVTGYDTAQEARWYERAVRPFHPAVVALVYCLNDAMIVSGPYNRFATPAELAEKDAQDALWDRRARVRAETLDTVAAEEERAALLRLPTRIRWWLTIQGYERSPSYTDELLLSHAEPDRASRVRSALGALGAALRSDGVRAYLFISPVLRAWESYPWRPIHAQVAGWGREAGFEVRDPLPAWQGRERPEDLRLPGDTIHYGPLGNERFGRFVAEAIAAR